MDVWFSPSRRTSVVETGGELDVGRAGALRSSLLRAEDASHLVVVDFADVTFADSVVAGLLMAAWRRATRGSKRFVIANAGGAALRTFDLLGTGHLLVDARQPVTV